MFKVLLKKQLYEAFRGWFYNRKTGTARSKGGTIITALLFAVLCFGVCGGSLGAAAVPICGALGGELSWLCFDLFAMMAILLGLFGSVFNTYSSLYCAKDNDQLLSLPIPVGMIISSRILTVYLMGTLYASIAFLPAVIVYQWTFGFNLTILLGNLVMLIEISLIVLVLSCLLGFVVAKISLKVKNRSFVVLLSSLLFIGLYYFVYFKAQGLIRDLIAHAAQYGETIKGSAYVLYVFGKSGTGSPLDALLCLAVCLAAAGMTFLILSKTFIHIATAPTTTKKATIRLKAQKESSVSAALLRKEWARFAGSANYMLNCGEGLLFLLVAGVALLIKGRDLLAALSASASPILSALPLGVAGIACFLSSMNDCATPSVSLEGKSLWVVQSLPIHPWQVIGAKIKLQLLLTLPALGFFLICALIVFPMSAADAVLCVAVSVLYALVMTLFDMFLGIKMPIFTWSNEIVPIKQSGNIAIALFGGWGYAALLVGGFIGLFLWKGFMNVTLYLGGFALLSAVLSVLLYRWLKTKGVQAMQTF